MAGIKGPGCGIGLGDIECFFQCVLEEWRSGPSMVAITWVLCLRPFTSQHLLVVVVTAMKFCGSSHHSI